jgi:hypothetical protein
LQIFTKSRAITKKKELNKSTQKYTGAQLHMLINISVKYHDSRSNMFWVTCDTSWKLQTLTKSRAITLKILNKSTWKYPGAHADNISIKFHDSRSNTFELPATQKRTDGRTEGRTCQHLGFMSFVFDLYEARRQLDVRPEGQTDGRTDKGKSQISKCLQSWILTVVIIIFYIKNRYR